MVSILLLFANKFQFIRPKNPFKCNNKMQNKNQNKKLIKLKKIILMKKCNV